MIYLMQIAGRFYFNRRVPEAFRKHDSRNIIRFSLKTTDRKTALRRAMSENDKLEAYWSTLLKTGHSQTEGDYAALTERAKALGYSYHPAPVLADMDIRHLLERLFHIEREKHNEKHIEALLGKAFLRYNFALLSPKEP